MEKKNRTGSEIAPSRAAVADVQSVEASIRARIFTIRGVQIMLDRDLSQTKQRKIPIFVHVSVDAIGNGGTGRKLRPVQDDEACVNANDRLYGTWNPHACECLA